MLIAAGVVIGGALLLALGLFGYAGSHMGQLPKGHPAELLGRGMVPAAKPVIVCFGDSLAGGTLGADWVGGLLDGLGDEAVVVNAGIGGQVTWGVMPKIRSRSTHDPSGGSPVDAGARRASRAPLPPRGTADAEGELTRMSARTTSEPGPHGPSQSASRCRGSQRSP